MNIYKVGDKQKVACHKCRSFENATFRLRNVPFSDGSGMVPNVMAGVCDKCGEVSVLPHQSSPLVKKQLERQRKSLECRLPAHMIDILNLACGELGATPEFVPTLVKFYVHALLQNSEAAEKIIKYLSSDLARGRADKRLSLKGKLIAQEIDELKVMTGVDSTTDLMKGIVLKINDELLIRHKSRPIQQLKCIMSAVA